MKAFLDGSGDKASDFLILTGVAAHDYVWDKFEIGWGEVLKSRLPIASQLHTVDLLAGAKEFSRDNGWTKEKHWALLWDCVKYAQTLDKLDFRVFTCTIDMGIYREMKSQGHKLPGFYSMCSRFSPELILKWYLKDFEKNFRVGRELHYFFDRGERHKGAFERRWIAGRKKSRLSNHWHLVKSVGTVRSVNHKPLQLADLISWAHCRRLMFDKYQDPEMEDGHEIWKVLDGVLPTTRKEIDRAGLEMFAYSSAVIPGNVEEELGPFP
jgi:Protein of unknown function (DUF3800)